MKKERIAVIITICILCFAISAVFKTNEHSCIDIPIEQWYLRGGENINIRWEEMWDVYSSLSKDKHTVKVAIVDTGIDSHSDEISESLKYADADDELGHGTKVAGIICASQYKGYAVGVADSHKTKIYSFKVIDGKSNSINGLINAIYKAEELGCDICNISLNTDVDSPNLKKCIETSQMLFVVSAGNGEMRGRNLDKEPSFPASYELDNLIAVANVQPSGRLNFNSNYGKCVDVAAPGTDIFNVLPKDEYSVSSGTSMATPIVTGFAAMLYICDHTMDAGKCKEIILESSTEERELKGKISKNRVINLYEGIRAVVNSVK